METLLGLGILCYTVEGNLLVFPYSGVLPDCSLIMYASLHLQVQSSVSAMLQLRDAKAASKNVPLFMDEGQPVYLVVQCIRIPEMYNQHFRL